MGTRIGVDSYYLHVLDEDGKDRNLPIIEKIAD
jgi:hypothetical protein